MLTMWIIGMALGRTDQSPFWKSKRYKARIKKKAGDKPHYRLWYKSMLAPFSFFYTPRWTHFFVLATVLQFFSLLCQTFGNSLSTQGITLQLLAMFFLGVFPYFLFESFSNPFMDDKLQYLQQFFNFTNALSVWNATALLGADDQISTLISVVAFVEHLIAFAIGLLAIWSVAYDYLEKHIKRIKTKWYLFWMMIRYRIKMVSRRWRCALRHACLPADHSTASRVPVPQKLPRPSSSWHRVKLIMHASARTLKW